MRAVLNTGALRMEPKIQLCIRNFPENFSESDISEFLNYFGIVRHRFIRRRNKLQVVTEAQDEVLGRTMLNRLHQLKILDRRLTVEYYREPNVEITELPPVQTTDLQQQTQELSGFVEALHAVHPVDFTQPPPPYLKYRYPRPTREIIDSICVALESVPKFYTQVLHLMNRMNLPPPFNPQDISDVRQSKSSITKQDASQQTDETMFLSDEESELESDTELSQLKTKIIQKTKNRFTPYLQAGKVPKVLNNKKPPEKLPQPTANKPNLKQIKISISEMRRQPIEKTTVIEKAVEILEPVKQPINDSSVITEKQLLENRIPSDQLSELPVFKNYTPGEPSNRLYIKNLAKSTTEEDLRNIFHSFAITSNPDQEITIKLMQTGRMKGQAFIGFSYHYEEDLDLLPEKPIEKARRLTNGYILRNKPMVVVYGKAVADTSEQIAHQSK
ncbi:RNA-binding region-containing protein 3 [Uranotaenia lowii]|uniref:RNA-binding region-containing protein 3 n=1 Tax=Uranotaenia lowii TaxID=190385 RepID=UPI0024784E62|nr:RNA-binding region-containing protein 3 [Uranotaenia lowii]